MGGQQNVTAYNSRRCAWCTDHCPARLNVSALNDDYELKQIDHARRLGVLACVGCGVCTYVCPARLPLAHRAGDLCQAVRDQARDMPLFATGRKGAPAAHDGPEA